MDAVDLAEAVFRIRVFPKLAAIMEEDTGKDEIAVEFRIDGTQRVGGTHHLGDVLDEAATAGVVVFPSGGGTAEAVA